MSLEPNNIYLGDCLELMKQIPDKSIDHIITDPPYEKEAHTLQRRVRRGNILGNECLDFESIDTNFRINIAKEMARVVKKWVIVFCQVEAAMIWKDCFESAGLNYKRTGVWIKPDGMPQYTGDRPGMGYESIVIMHTPGRSKWNGGGSHGVWIYKKGDNGGKKNPHPTMKPRQLMKKLIQQFTNKNELILDPFLGSGTTAIACYDLNRLYIGIEKEPKYFDIAKKRIDTFKAQGRLF